MAVGSMSCQIHFGQTRLAAEPGLGNLALDKGIHSCQRLISLTKKPVGSEVMAEYHQPIPLLMLETGGMQAPLQRDHPGCAGTLFCRHKGDSQAHL